MSSLNNPNDPNAPNDLNNPETPWTNEQAPFVGAETAAANAAASAEAGAAPGSASYAAGAAGSAYAAGPPPGGGYMPPGGYPGAAYARPAGYAPPPVVSSGEPSPVLAFFIGLIPGVGAMYNGQVAKGIVHLIVFAVLVTIANNVSDVFGIFVAGWIFFQAFEAYHTAKARRDGLPLPNAFGWNDIGERIGLGKNWPFSPGAAAPARPVQTAPVGSAATGSAGGWGSVPPTAGTPTAGTGAGTVPPVPPMGSATYAPPTGVPGVAPNWVGYVPPTAFGGPPPVFGTGSVGAGAVPPGHGVPYAPVNAGIPNAGVPYIAPGAPLDVPAGSSGLPVGAMWLIGLGVLFLVGQWTPLLQLSRVWIPSLLLAGLAVFLFARRMGWTRSAGWQQSAALPMGLRIASAVRTPGALLAIAVLNGLHEAWVVRWNRSWPWLLIVIGVLMLVERAALRQAGELDPHLGAYPDANLNPTLDPSLNPRADAASAAQKETLS